MRWVRKREKGRERRDGDWEGDEKGHEIVRH